MFNIKKSATFIELFPEDKLKANKKKPLPKQVVLGSLISFAYYEKTENARYRLNDYATYSINGYEYDKKIKEFFPTSYNIQFLTGKYAGFVFEDIKALRFSKSKQLIVINNHKAMVHINATTDFLNYLFVDISGSKIKNNISVKNITLST